MKTCKQCGSRDFHHGVQSLFFCCVACAILYNNQHRSPVTQRTDNEAIVTRLWQIGSMALWEARAEVNAACDDGTITDSMTVDEAADAALLRYSKAT